MKRHILFVIATFAYTIGLMAQGMPAGYYDAIEGKEDSVLNPHSAKSSIPPDAMKPANAINTELAQ